MSFIERLMVFSLLLIVVIILGPPLFIVCEPAGPNLLLITLDTTRADHLSCYGYPRETTPHLDRLASQGLLFSEAVAVSSWTLPTHASLFTGLHPSTHGAHHASKGRFALDQAVLDPNGLYSDHRVNALPEEALTLAEILRDAGFWTAGVGAGPWLKPIFGLAQGFEEYDCRTDSTAGRRADEVTDRAIELLQKGGDKPFFLFLNYFDPHSPWDPPPELRFRFFPEERLAQISEDPQRAVEFDISQYDSEIFFMDREIGRLLDEMKELGLYENTWIVVIGDHGELLGEHGLWWHGFGLFEQEVKIPLIAKGPEAWRGFEEQRISQVDLLPALLKSLDLALPEGTEGMGFQEGERPPVACELFTSPGMVRMWGPRFDRELIALYQGPFKLVRSSRENDPDAGLFRVDQGAREPIDLSDLEPERREEMERLFRQWVSTRPTPLVPGGIPTLDAATQRQLESLGY